MNNTKGDVIAAISTPVGRGAISCIRLSGFGSVETVKKLTEGFDGNKHALMVPCKFNGRIKDKIVAVAYLNGKGYTGEESVELYFHGGKFLTEQALLSVIDAGARIAEAGEFTRRAFLNGKIDLTQAEGIGDLIDGDNSVTLLAAFEQSEGKIRKAIDAIYEKTVTAAARAEVCIDYPEEDIEEQTREQLKDSLNSIIRDTEKEIKGYDGGRIKRDGARVIITGKTNAGKSTLFNTLLGEERAIVSDEEGTTRDTIEEKVIYKNTAFVLVDTAGIRETNSKAEKLGIERSINERNKADIIINVLRENEKNTAEILDENAITVINSFKSLSDVKNEVCGAIVLNAKTGKGVEILKEKIFSAVKRLTDKSGCINNARQYAALKSAYESLKRAVAAINMLTLDCVCADLREALDAIGKITGKNASDSVIDEIFSKFCVGK